MAEGSVWEALEHAAFWGLDNLIVFVDVNRLGQSTQTMHGWDTSGCRHDEPNPSSKTPSGALARTTSSSARWPRRVWAPTTPHWSLPLPTSPPTATRLRLTAALAAELWRFGSSHELLTTNSCSPLKAVPDNFARP